MRQRFFATTCLSTLILGVAGRPALAQTVTISAAQTAPVATSTASSGSPADISIASGGSITPSASGAAVTIDSANSVTNAGTISSTDLSGSTGILANGGVSGSITNSGTVTESESYVQTDTNGDGVVDGPFADGSDRFGIHALGALTGDVTNSGTITVQGNNSAGIALDGQLTGSLNQSGTITVRGDNSVGISAAGITGAVGVAGTVSATGTGASAVVLNGDIGGALTVQGTLSSTGYTSETLPTTTTSLGADNLLQGGPTLAVAGSVAGGMIITAAGSLTNPDGTTATTVLSTIISYGSAAGVQIGSATRATTLGVFTGDANGLGLEVNGEVHGGGVYDGVAANGLVIGGLGGAVTIAGGVGINGTVTAVANDASATAVRIGSGATVPLLANTGTITASGPMASGQVATAIAIDSGASVPTVTNSGAVTATTTGTDATAIAFIDRSGTVSQFTNTGTITATGGTATALDVSASTQGVTVTQAAPASGTTKPSITGDIRFGSGNDALDVSAGSVTGNVSFGGGADSFALSGTSTFTGDADYASATGGALSVGSGATFTGTLSNAGGTAVSVNGGTLTLTATGAVPVGSLAVSNGGTLGLQVNGATGAVTQYQVAGAASFGTGSTIALHFTDINHVVGDYSLIQAASITGAGNVAVSGSTLPYLFTGTVGTNATNTDLDVIVARKTAAQLGLNRAETAAYEPIFAAISGDSQIGGAFLSLTDAGGVTKALRSLMPDFAGGAFDSVTLASRASTRFLADPAAPIYTDGPWGVWLQQVGWFDHKSVGDTAGYQVSGWGLSMGGERSLGKVGRIGLSFAYLVGNDDDSSTPNQVTDTQYEFGGYWRSDWGKLHAYARGSYATIAFNSQRHFTGTDVDGTAVVDATKGHWTGALVSGSSGLSYQVDLGAFSLRPQVSVDYDRLREGSYAESGGGSGMDLTVDARTSKEFAANEALAFGYRIFDDRANDGGFMRLELEGGRRQIINGSLGATTAHFDGGEDFTLLPDERSGSWTGAVRLKGGSNGFTVSGEADEQHQQGLNAVALRAGVQMSF